MCFFKKNLSLLFIFKAKFCQNKRRNLVCDLKFFPSCLELKFFPSGLELASGFFFSIL